MRPVSPIFFLSRSSHNLSPFDAPTRVLRSSTCSSSWYPCRLLLVCMSFVCAPNGSSHQDSSNSSVYFIQTILSLIQFCLRCYVLSPILLFYILNCSVIWMTFYDQVSTDKAFVSEYLNVLTS